MFTLIRFCVNGQISDSTILKKHVDEICSEKTYRSYQNIEELNRVAKYLFDQMLLCSDSVKYQPYKINDTEFKNVICSFGTQNSQRIIVGAHYDVCENQAGADDNASGVAGLLELCRLLKNQDLKYRIDLIAYSLEEPPYFRSKYMGSYVHAQYLKEKKISVKGMICLEMIGYFDERKHTQNYPAGILKLIYGTRGNYITVVQKFNNGKFGRKAKKYMKRQHLIRTKSFKGPKALPGIDFSDHLNYWKFGYPAVMITNTAFYRNKNYHQVSDLPQTLNYKKMALVVDEVYQTLISFK